MKREVALTLAVSLMAFSSSAFSANYAKPEYSNKVEKHYSPYVGRYYPQQVFWGDTHLHTSYSTDAGMAGNTVGPDDAYRFAKGAVVTTSTGQKARLKRPLDFLVIADHAENLGLAPFIERSDPSVLKNTKGKKWHDMVKNGKGYDAFIEWIAEMNTGMDPLPSKEMAQSAWSDIIKAAEAHNKPGAFTAIIGFEWTSAPGGNNLHRNILFRDGADVAKQVVPMSLYDSEDPEDLWKWMEAVEEKTAGRVLAIPHNGNLSNGLMFDDVTLKTKKELTTAYAESRSRWEPVVEVTQPKGTGEAHPFLSPDDAFADFELIDKGNLSGSEAKTKEMLKNEYAREALKRGLVYQKKLGVNPFKFGMVGSTDAHGGLASTEEENWWGKANIVEPSPERFKDVLIESLVDDELSIMGIDLGASGLAAVWARENTREAIWDAFKNREVYGTTGGRMLVRVFGGWDFTEEEVLLPDFAAQGYERGVPMGGDLSKPPEGGSPTFMIRALRDVSGANLDRIQVIKGWVDKDGKSHERIYDVAVSDGREIDANGVCSAPVGSTVDIPNASYTNTIGEPLLTAWWQDPDFDPAEDAFYYVRVLEIPKPRWTAYDAKFYNITMPEGTRMTVQDRAYTSPIWYTP